ncbi:MAG TPA: nodulation protein NfeD [Actinomycetota bacterium]|nr:nodulation protein NfeD [Actinomycetota bacterium]
MKHPSIRGAAQRAGPGRGSRLVAWILIAFVGLVLAASGPAGAQASSSILAVTIDGVITPVMADHIREALDRAETEGHQALLVQLDTPGGLDTSMRDIIQSFLNTRVPVIVHVSPQGARAASAGALITLSSHVAAMAPGTSIGAATPIGGQGGEDLEQKIIEDAASYAESIAEERGRNVDFAIDAVREGTSIAANEALEIGVIEIVARDRAELVAELDGRAVELAPGDTVTLETTGVQVVEVEMGFARSVLQWLADPNLAFLFISIGTLAIIYELANPGIGAGGITGAILLLLAFTALSVLPVSAAGVILLVLAGALFVAELFVPGVGVFAAGGTVALILGGLFLFRGPIGVDPAALWPVAILVGGGALGLGRVAWRTRRLVGVSGTAAVVGARGVVKEIEGNDLQVFVQGSWWGARARSGPLRPGQDVRVVEMEGLRLIVEPEEMPEPGNRPIEEGER